VTFEIIFQTILNSMQYASILALSSFAIVLIFKTSVTTNFAQGTISVFGAFVTAYLFTLLNVNMFWSLLIGVVVGFVMGWLVDTQIFRRSRRLTGIGKQMITMGLVLFLMGIIPAIFGQIPLNLGKLIPGNLMFVMFGKQYVINYHSLLSTGLTIVILTILFLILKFTKWGLGVRATASSEMVAGLMGVNTHRITAMSWAIAGGLGTFAAILYGATLGQVSPAFMTNVQVGGFLANILGGFGTFYGPVVGAVLITFSSNLVGFSFSVWKDVIIYGLILIVILFLPRGLFGKKAIKKV